MVGTLKFYNFLVLHITYSQNENRIKINHKNLELKYIILISHIVSLLYCNAE